MSPEMKNTFTKGITLFLEKSDKTITVTNAKRTITMAASIYVTAMASQAIRKKIYL